MTFSKLKRVGDNAAANMQNYGGRPMKPLQLLQYAGNGTVSNEKTAAKKKRFSVTIENLTDNPEVAVLFYPATAGESVNDYVEGIALKNGVIQVNAVDTLNVTTQRYSWERLLTHLFSNPTAILEWRFTAKNSADMSNNELQLQEILSRKIEDPFRPANKIEEISLGKYFDKGQFQGGFIDVPEGFVPDANTFAWLTILPKTKLTIEISFGPTYNAGRGLENFVIDNGVMNSK